MMRSALFGAVALVGMSFSLLVRGDGVNWPQNQLLPTFSTPAPMLDCVDLSYASRADVNLLVSLEGIVNRTQPRLVSVARREGEGKFTWLKLHNLSYRMMDRNKAVLKYRTNVTGLVVPDPDEPDTINLATTIAGVNNEMICDPSLLAIFTNGPYDLPIIDDLRGRFADKYAVYNYLYSNYWPRCTHRIFAGMEPNLPGHLRDYLIAVKAATVWLGPGIEKDAKLLGLFALDMKPVSGVYMGWWPGEGDGLEWIAKYGIPVLASDFFCNATVFSGVSHRIDIPKIPEPPPLENKVYVAMILSDGDNVQYMQHAMKMSWDKPARGTIPIGWTASPLAVDLDPMMLNYYWNSATTNDCLISGPSGAGYAHVNNWKSDYLTEFARVSDPYLQRSGLRVITIWDRVTHPVGRAFAANCLSLLGLTDQSGNYNATDQGLQTIGLTPTYTSTVRELKEWIVNAAASWNGAAPLFIAAQANVWNMGPTELAEVARELDPKKYKLVRPDQLFLLSKKAQTLRVLRKAP